MKRHKDYDKYVALSKRVHNRTWKWSGGSVVIHVEQIDSLMEEYSATTALDYGCGKAKHHPEHWKGFAKFDPAHEDYNKRPAGKFDMVICTDVMEHVPESCVDWVLNDIFQYSNSVVFLSISTREAEHRLPNGENMHVTIKPLEWWQERVERIASNFDVHYVLVEGA
jgi:hypothetical protein